MPVPDELVGAWRRTGLFINGVRQVDHCDVLWLQSSTWFGDIRLRIDPATEPTHPAARRMARVVGSGGTADWSAPLMTWTSTLGPRVGSATDAYELSWEDGVVVERGTIEFEDDTFTFAEEWLRMSTPSDEPTVTRHEDNLQIAIDRWAIRIGTLDGSDDLFATRSELINHTWTEIGSAQV